MKYIYTYFFLIIFSMTVSASGKINELVYGTDTKFINDACLSRSGAVVICTDDKSLKIFNVYTRENLGNFTGGHNSKILSVDLSPDSTMLVSGGNDSIVVLWDFISQSILQRITFATGKITSVKFSPDSKTLLFGCSNSRAYLYDIYKKKILNEFSDANMDLTSVLFSPDGNYIAIGGADKLIRIYNSVNYKLEAILKGHKNWVRSMAFYMNGRKLISCGDDGRVFQWDLIDLKKIKQKSVRVKSGWKLSVDIENENKNQYNMFVVGTIKGNLQINYLYGEFKKKFKKPINKVMLIPANQYELKVIIATLGSGLICVDAMNMTMSH